MLLKGEGETKTVVKTKVRRECEGCGEPATLKHTYLNDGPSGARRNPASSAYGRDDCSWCSDHDLYLCDECVRRDNDDDVPDGYHWCSTFNADRMPHLFLRWDEREIESLAQAVG